MADKTQSVTLYHGTASAYSGVPTQGYKDLLGSGYPSMSGDPDVAEFFASGKRTSRVYSLDVPKSQILDLTKETEELSEQGKWDEISKLIKKAAASGKYQAVAHYDITFGTDDPEYRFVGKVPQESWHVRPSADAQERYAHVDAILKRFNAGEKITDKERRQTLRTLKEDAHADDIKKWEWVWKVLDEDGRGDQASAEDREAQRENYKELSQQIQALESKAPSGKADRGKQMDSKEPKPTAAKKTPTIKSKNKVWGFYGTYSRSDATKQYTVDQAWDAAVKAYISRDPIYTGAMARKYLDSSDGRHYAEAVIDDILDKGHSLDDAADHNVDWKKKKAPDKPVLYQGHKGPGVGMLKADAPNRRDGDKDTVVAERRPRASEKHPKSPIKLSDYGDLQDAIQNYKQTANVSKQKKTSAASAEKMMGYRPAKKKSHYTPKAGRGGSEMKASKK